MNVASLEYEARQAISYFLMHHNEPYQVNHAFDSIISGLRLDMTLTVPGSEHTYSVSEEIGYETLRNLTIGQTYNYVKLNLEAMAKDIQVEMAEKKKVLTKKKEIDPNKVKKPLCPFHRVKMDFNSQRSLWECSEEGCYQIARPKSETEPGQVVMGKGNVSLHVISGPGPTNEYLLVSDNNVAINITPLLKSFDIDTEVMDQVDTLTSSTVSLPSQEVTLHVLPDRVYYKKP